MSRAQPDDTGTAEAARHRLTRVNGHSDITLAVTIRGIMLAHAIIDERQFRAAESLSPNAQVTQE